MSWGAPQYLWGLLALPLLALLFVYAESKTMQRLHEFVSARLLPQLAGTVDRLRRVVRLGLQLLALGLAIIALAQPRWGYVYEEAKRKGLDLFIAVDTSRSMLSNDVPPNRLERVKLATQDLMNELQGDRVGLIAFAGRAFVQAPLTIDYGAVVEAINDLDTKTIPEGGTNISEAIDLANKTYGKSATGNRALILFTDGEELSGDAVKVAKSAADAGVRIFTIGVGTAEGSLIPIPDESGGGTAFVKDSKGQVVKSKLDEKRLREIAEATGGFYLRLENGPQTMRQLFNDGLAKMSAAEIDARLSRKPIERYEWPLGAAMAALTMSILLRERKRARSSSSVAAVSDRRNDEARMQIGGHRPPLQSAIIALLFLGVVSAYAAVPGLELYRDGKYADAYRSFQDDLQKNPNSRAKDKMLFDTGAAAYKMRDYNKAIEAFSGALLSRDKDLQEKSHFNSGRTLEERADMDKNDDDALHDLTNAQTHYEDTLKLNPNNEAARANLEEVKKKIERLKNKRQPTPTPTPPPPQQQKKDQNQQDQSQSQQDQQQNQQNQQQQEEQQQQSSSQNQQQSQSQNQSGESKQDQQQQAKNKPQSKPDESPSPSANDKNTQDRQSPSEQDNQKGQSDQNATPSPSPGEDDQQSAEGESPSPAPAQSPQKKFEGEIKRADGEKPAPSPEQSAAMAEAEENQQGQMSERQAEALLRSMKDEEARVQLDEHRTARRVYNDW